MRSSLLLGVAALGISVPGALWAHAARRPDPDRFFESDPRQRADRGERERWWGAALSGSEQATADDPTDGEMLRRRFRNTLRVAALAVKEAGLSVLLAENVEIYLARREAIDPDGRLLEEALHEFVNLRLELPLPHFFYARVGVAVYLAGRGDPRGTRVMWECVSQGPLYGELFRFARRYHPPFPALREFVVHYLEQGNLDARIQAAGTLLEYHGIYGEGADLLERYRPMIRADCKEALIRLYRPTQNLEVRDAGGVALFNLALLGGDEDRELLRTLPAGRGEPPQHVTAFRVARFACGLTPLRRMGLTSARFKLLDADGKEAYCRAAAHNYVRATDPAEKARWRRLVEAALKYPDDDAVRIYAMHTLLRHSPAHAGLAREMAAARSVESIFAAVRLDPGEALPHLLPKLALPNEALSGMIAVHLLKRLPG
ncbi:MAG: hypothetical protein ACE5JG_02205 [Planctomycetota bacterium]